VRFGTTSLISGGARFGDAVREIAQRGIVPRNSWQHFCPPCEYFIPGHMIALPSNTRGGSPVRELRPPGFVRGALSNECPYRDRLQRVDVMFSIVYPDSDNELRPSKNGAFST
jgi:hypothetical protein